jgi:hypothetical protein
MASSSGGLAPVMAIPDNPYQSWKKALLVKPALVNFT